MVTEKELQEAIDDLEQSPSSYKVCALLAALYALKDRYFGGNDFSEPLAHSFATEKTQIIHSEQISDFLKAVEGKSWKEILPIIDELLTAVKIYQPKLYEAFLRRL